MNSRDLQELKRKLINDLITPQKVAEIIYSKKNVGQEFFRTDEYKKTRDDIIKPSCEQCGSNDGLRLQRLWSPGSYSGIKSEVSSKYRDLIYEKYSPESLVSEEEVFTYFNEKIEQKRRDVCPYCGAKSIRKRKTMSPKYVCVKCDEQFDEALNRLTPEFFDDRNRKEKPPLNTKTYTWVMRKVYNEKCYKLLCKEYGDQIEKETLLIVIDEDLRYRSLSDTMTLCKRCAFAWKKNMDLCPVCGKGYKDMSYKQCYECYKKSPEYKPKPVYDHPIIDYTVEELDDDFNLDIDVRKLLAEIKKAKGKMDK